MTKREAYERLDKGDLTWGHLKHFITQCYDQDRTVISAVNPSLSRGQSLDILSAAVEPKEDNELLLARHYSAAKRARNSLIAVNVLRETHWNVSQFVKCLDCGGRVPVGEPCGRCGLGAEYCP